MVNLSIAPKMEVPTVADAFTASQVADELYNDFCEKCPTDYEGQNILRDIANDADRRLWQAREAALNECRCVPNRDMVCAVCAARQKTKYGDSIPIVGEL